ncbi:efflux RND transporter permease subunit [Undibacterium sp.]|uniref:efflux RND transporter permease subunit n=1 Tax=Undibacterium sp. TaxID=1914977 RepID=UPI00272EED67|nr:efflux RND transporter permease subunit [Undibacterium sp.]MDP1979454.1 efflux RND transporter permease subunit [Undibacterium sp.]
MIKLTAYAFKNPRLLIACIVLITGLGISLFLNYPAQEDPPIKVREAIVSAYYPGMSPERVEQLLTRPLEEKIREIPEVQRITSTAFTGGTIISVKLYDKYFQLEPLWQKLRNKMADARSSLPDGVNGPGVNDDFGNVAIATLAITADGYRMAEMRQVALKLRDNLTGLPGVRRVEVHGLPAERIYLEGSPAQLSRLGLSLGDVLASLQKQNVVLPGGQVIADKAIVTLEPTGNFSDMADIEKTPILIPKTGQAIALSDVLTLRRAYVEPRSTGALFNNKPAIVLAISMAEGGNVVAFGQSLKARIAEVKPGLPLGFMLDFATFQPEVVSHLIADVERTLYETLVIVLIVVMVFLGMRTGLIVGTIVPLTMLMSLIIMSLMGIELQRVSIASMIIALGLLVDNGIVIAEDIMRRLVAGEDRKQACIDAGTSLSTPLLTSALTIVLAFMPLLLADDQTGEYVRSLAQVTSIAVLSSWVLALTFTPLVCYHFMKVSASHQQESEEHYDSRFYRGYRRLLEGILRQPLIFLAAVTFAFVLAISGFGLVSQQFFPNSERNQYMILVNLPAGSPYAETEQAIKKIDAWLLDRKTNPEVSSVVSYVGYGGPRFVLAMAPVAGAPHRGYIVVNVPLGTSVDAPLERTRNYLYANFPELRAEVKKFWLGGSETGLVEFRITGSDATTLKTLAEQLKQQLRSLPDTIDVKDDWENRTWKLLVKVDQAMARRAGITSSDVALSLNGALTGIQVSVFRDSDQTIPIVVTGKDKEMMSYDKLKTLNVFSENGQTSVPLIQIAELIGVPEDGAIRRRNGIRTVTVSGKSLSLSANALVKRMRPQIEKIKLDEGYRIGVGGELETSGNAQGALVKFLPVALASILLLMLWQFSSYRKVLIIAITIPLCLVGAVAGLLLTRANFGFMAIMGILALAGIIINNAVLLLERIAEELHEGKPHYEAVVMAALKRLRPIVMTKLTCILGLVPLMLFGGELWFGMAVVIVGGLALGTVLTLGVIPVMYTILFRVKKQV